VRRVVEHINTVLTSARCSYHHGADVSTVHSTRAAGTFSLVIIVLSYECIIKVYKSF